MKKLVVLLSTVLLFGCITGNPNQRRCDDKQKFYSLMMTLEVENYIRDTICDMDYRSFMDSLYKRTMELRDERLPELKQFGSQYNCGYIFPTEEETERLFYLMEPKLREEYSRIKNQCPRRQTL